MVHIPADDRAEIQELTHKYAFYADRKEWEAVLDLFTDDGLFDETALGVPVMDGKDAIRAYYSGDLVGGVDYFVHYVTNHIISEYSGDHASGICYVLGLGRFTNGTEVQVLGYKEDEYVKVSGQWRFKSRVLRTFTKPKGMD